MRIHILITNLLSQLSYVIGQLTNDEYMRPLPILSNSSIGQHTRHIIEFYTELNKGYASRLVNYDQRVRNHQIESDRSVAADNITVIIEGLDKPDRELLLNLDLDQDAGSMQIYTNYYRELVYNLEHTVHHMAIIRIGVSSISAACIPEEFGVASSTLKYRKQCAQ